MKKQLSLLISLIFYVLCPLTAVADKITIVSDAWCPYNCEPGSNDPGYMIEIAQQSFKSAGHTVEYSNMSFKDAIEEARKGKYTALVGVFKTDAPGFIFPENPLGSGQSVFFVKKGNPWRYNGIDSLKKVKIGVVQDYSYGDEFDKYIAANKGKPSVQAAGGATPLQVNIDKLMKGNIDAFIEDPSVFANYCGSKGLYNVMDIIKDAGASAPKAYMYIAFSPANPKSKEYAATLSAGIERLRKTGELKKILSKYYVKDWE